MFVHMKVLAVPATAIVAIVIGVLALSQISAPAPIPGSDKTHHVIAFATLVFPIALLRPKKLLWVVLFATVYGGVIELIQPHVGRFKSFGDFQADLVGIAFGTILGLSANFAQAAFSRRRSPRI